MAGQITALVAQQRNKERVNVFIDGEFAFGLAMIEAIKLKRGQHLTDEDIERLKALDEIEIAHDRALNYLSYRPRSTKEVRDNLKNKGIDEIAIEQVIDRLTEAGLLNDEDFARFWLQNRDQFKPRGERALRYELRQKGIADGIIELALEELDEDDAAYRAASRRARRYQDADPMTFRKKVGDFLMRRGFSYDIVRDTVDRLWAEIQQET